MVWMNLFIGQQGRNRHREQTYGHGWGKERVGGMNKRYHGNTLPYVKQIAKGRLLYDSGNSNLGSETT